MTEPDFETILELCLERIAGGDAPEQCLEDYPAQAEKLRPYLEIAGLLARQPTQQATRAADRQVLAFVQGGERSRPAPAAGPFSSSLGIVGGPVPGLRPELLALAAALLGMLLAGAFFGQRWSLRGQPAAVCAAQDGLWLVSLEWCLGGDSGRAQAVFVVDGTTRLDCYRPPLSEEERELVYLCQAGRQAIALFAQAQDSWRFTTAAWDLSAPAPPAPSGRLRITALTLADGSHCQAAGEEPGASGKPLHFTCPDAGLLLGQSRMGPGGRLEASSLAPGQTGSKMAVTGQQWLPVERLIATGQ